MVRDMITCCVLFGICFCLVSALIALPDGSLMIEVPLVFLILGAMAAFFWRAAMIPIRLVMMAVGLVSALVSITVTLVEEGIAWVFALLVALFLRPPQSEQEDEKESSEERIVHPTS